MVSMARTYPSGALTRAMTAVCAALVLLALPTQVAAQYFGRNKVQYDNFDFRILKTPHFDIHFYPEEATAVEDAARMSERWSLKLGHHRPTRSPTHRQESCTSAPYP